MAVPPEAMKSPGSTPSGVDLHTPVALRLRRRRDAQLSRPRYAPPGLRFESPVENLGPAGLLGINSLFSLDPHSAPGGLVFYASGSLPSRYERSFFLARFGNLVGYSRIGFDVLNVRQVRRGGRGLARTERFLDHMGRPIDLCLGSGRLYVVEYGRQKESVGPGASGYAVGGRVLEVRGKP